MIRRNVLIFHSGGLGDFVLTWPLGLALGRLYPQSRVIYVTQESKGRLAERALRLDWRDAEMSWPALYGNPAGLGDKALSAVVQSHSVFSFLASEGDAFCRNVAALSPQATIVALRGNPPAGFAGHAVEYLVAQLSPWATVHAAVEQILASLKSRGLGTWREGNKTLLVHPGSGGRDKCWPVESYVRLIEKVAKSRPVRVVLGEVELERFSAEQIRQFEGAAPVVRPGNYVELYDQLSGAGGFVGNDSGPAHLAGMMGVPTVAIFGATDPAVWGPIGPRVRIVNGPEMGAVPVNDVEAALGELT